MTDYDILWHFLELFFNYEHYEDGIKNAKMYISENPKNQDNWSRIKKAVQEKQFSGGEPLKLVNEGANQVLDENSDEEAYFWLNKMIDNIERDDGIVDAY